MYDVNGMGNMSTLEQKVDALLRFCMAQTEAERQKCRTDVAAICGNGKKSAQRQDVCGCIDKILRELGVPDKLNGFAFLRSCVLSMVDRPELCHAVTTVLYPQVARMYNVSAFTVERGVRYAIEAGWTRCDEETQRKFFGNQIDPERAKPTNAQFLVRVANLTRRSISRLQNGSGCGILVEKSN